MEQENRLAGQKNYLHNSREELFAKLKKKKKIKNIEIASECSLQY